eukprot:598684-Rhodomonas_salina.1
MQLAELLPGRSAYCSVVARMISGPATCRRTPDVSDGLRRRADGSDNEGDASFIFCAAARSSLPSSLFPPASSTTHVRKPHVTCLVRRTRTLGGGDTQRVQELSLCLPLSSSSRVPHKSDIRARCVLLYPPLERDDVLPSDLRAGEINGFLLELLERFEQGGRRRNGQRLFTRSVTWRSNRRAARAGQGRVGVQRYGLDAVRRDAQQPLGGDIRADLAGGARSGALWPHQRLQRGDVWRMRWEVVLEVALGAAEREQLLLPACARLERAGRRGLRECDAGGRACHSAREQLAAQQSDVRCRHSLPRARGQCKCAARGPTDLRVLLGDVARSSRNLALFLLLRRFLRGCCVVSDPSV